MKKQTTFRLALLPLAILSSFSYAETLDEITVNADREGAKTKTNVVTTETINESTATDLRELLSAEPSINFGGGAGTSQWLTIRGMGQDQVDLKVDNAYSDTQVFHHQGRFMLDPSLVKIVSVQKGTGSASAGIGATSGAIVARTVDAKDLLKEGQDFGFKVNVGASSNSGWSKGGALFGKYGKVDALVVGNWVTENNYKDGNGYKVANSALGQRGLLAKFGIDINDDHRIVLSHRQERHYGERALREEFDFNQSNSPNNQPRYRITTQDTSNLEWIGKNMGFISSLTANVYRMDVSREEPANNSETKVTTKGANLNLDSEIGQHHLIKYGVNWRKQQGKPNSLGADITSGEQKEDVGVYAEGIWGIGPVTLTTGLRYDHFEYKTNSGKEVSDGNFNPSVGLIWDITDDLSVNSSLNYATRSPRLYEVMLTGSRVITADDDLKAERSRNTEIGFNYNLNDSVALNGSYFWQSIKDAQAIRSENGVYTVYNGGTLKNHGYELGASYKYEGLTLRAGVAHSKPKLDGQVVDNIVMAIPTGRTWTTGISYRFANPNLELGWQGRFVESTSYDTTTNNRGGGATTTKRPGYGVSDFFINWKPTGNDDLNINFALDNAFNKYYKSHSQRAGINALPAVGRDFRVGINYTF